MDNNGYTNTNENNRGQFSNQYPHPEVMTEQTPKFIYGQPETNQKKSGFLPGILVGMLISFTLVFGAFVVITAFRMFRVTKPTSAQANQAAPTSAINPASSAKLQKIEQIIKAVYYKDEDIDVKKMEDGMYSGLLQSLGDQYSVYYNEEEMKELMNSTVGVYYGIGSYLSMDETTGCAICSGTIPDTPAEEVGMRYGDLIYKVDGELVQGLSLEEIVAKVRGEKGTVVHLTLYREGEPDYLEMDIERRKIESPTVTHEMLKDDIGYIRITEFDDVTTDQFTDAYATIKGNSPKGLIIDLRGNPGGNVDTVVNIANQILPKGLVFYKEDKNGEKVEYKSDGEHEIQIPLVILVDAYSASASEILAGAVKDYGIGKLVGTTTFGKGIVQRIISLSDGTALKVTESSYYTPAGNNIHGVGIEPDVEIKFEAKPYYDEGIDNQLEKGIEVIKEMMK